MADSCSHSSACGFEESSQVDKRTALGIGGRALALPYLHGEFIESCAKYAADSTRDFYGRAVGESREPLV